MCKAQHHKMVHLHATHLLSKTLLIDWWTLLTKLLRLLLQSNIIVVKEYHAFLSLIIQRLVIVFILVLQTLEDGLLYGIGIIEINNVLFG